MANHQVPRRARRIEQIHGVDADGNVITCAVFKHTRQGHARPMFYIVQYRERNRRIDRPSRVTREFTGPAAHLRLEAALKETRSLLADSRLQAARLAPAGKAA